ncbi:MAG TPA: DNA topoisomerase VI subunit B [Candidatus Polarisedimenticolia bacterium]|nr:DNA topoisomerase VI subunit B [Candidatus Polarisedimenticolia bacterium]
MAKTAAKKSAKRKPPPRQAAARLVKPQMSLFEQNPEPHPAAKETAPVRPAAPDRRRETAESLASRQREISVSEFFTKNRHLLGFDNPAKALLTAIKEAVDNSLDACEEAGILPKLEITMGEVEEDRFRITVTDNGPGIMKAQIPKIFGKLLYGSKFHTLKQSRGQQGIGISAAGMYSQLTTGKPVRIVSRTGKGKPAHVYEIQIDTRKNAPEVLTEGTVEWPRDHGTSVEMELQATYKKGRRSVDDYVSQTALANPHAEIVYTDPKGETFHHPRLSQDLPREPIAIKPHPYGVELGVLIKMLKETRSRNLRGALQADFSRVSGKVADEIAAAAGLRPEARPHSLSPAEVERLFRAIPKVKIMSPPTSCLSPIGETLIQEGLTRMIPGCDFYAAVTRSPAVYRGNPFQIEAGLAYGGPLPADELSDLWRFANRVPLQYQQAACAMTRSVILNDWKNYGLMQSRGGLPTAPMVVFVHMASAWVPFTSESKEAIAAYPEIVKEIRLALQECGRRLGAFLRHRRRVEDAEKKRSYIEKYIPHIGIALKEILGFSAKEEARVVETLKETLERSRVI